jgi:hypothetical protein
LTSLQSLLSWTDGWYLRGPDSLLYREQWPSHTTTIDLKGSPARVRLELVTDLTTTVAIRANDGRDLSASFCARIEDMGAWRIRCEIERLEATQLIVALQGGTRTQEFWTPQTYLYYPALCPTRSFAQVVKRATMCSGAYFLLRVIVIV